MNNRTLELFRLCQKAKEYGIDAFFSYSPHVGAVTIQVYKNGWYQKRYENGEYVLDDNNEPVTIENDAYFYLNEDEPKKFDEAILYLTNVIKEKSSQVLQNLESK